MGDAVQMAQAVHRVYALTGTPPPAPVSPPAAPTPTAPSATPAGLGIDTAGIDAALGHAGKAEGGVYKLTVARAETITDMGMTEPAAMGVATVINFQPTGGGQAAVTGDFALLDSEVQGVEATLRGAGLEVTALHAHMLTETPHLAYLHFFAVDDAVKLARSLGAALAKTNSAKG